MRRAGRVVAGVLALAVTAVAAACTPIARDPLPERTPTFGDVAPELERFYTQQIDWETCDGADEGSYFCASVTAPRDWDEPDAGDLSIALIMRAATSSDPLGSLLVNPGGPGASGYDLIRDSTTFAVGETLMDRFDVVGFDPRGVGRSTAVHCLDAAQMDEYLFTPAAAPRGTPEWEAELTARNEVFAEACDTASDGILPFITTEYAARDMDLLRALLGDEKLNYLGYSYGAYLGAVYAELYPENVGRMVLDGGIDPSIAGVMVGARQAAGFESALRAFMASCLGMGDCPFSGSVDQGMAQVADMLAAADASPVPASDGRLMDGDALSMGIITALYNEGNWPFLASALTAALEGDADDVFRLVDLYYGRSDGRYLDNSTEAFTAYNCMDYPADSPEVEAEADAIVAAQAPTFAPYWSGVDTCTSWPYPPTGTRERITAEGADPIVLIGTTNDPATPYEWAVALAEQLSSGVLITRQGEGHLGFNRGNACVDDAVVAYFVDGTVPTDGLTC